MQLIFMKAGRRFLSATQRGFRPGRTSRTVVVATSAVPVAHLSTRLRRRNSRLIRAHSPPRHLHIVTVTWTPSAASAEDLSEGQQPFEAPQCSSFSLEGDACSLGQRQLAQGCATPGLAGVCVVEVFDEPPSRCLTRQADTNYDVCSSPLDNFNCICVMGACEEIFDGFVCEPATPAPVTMAPATPAPVTPGGATCAGTDIEGIVGTNDRGSACCPLGCTQCGGQGCGTSGSAEDLKNVDCCINGVLDNQELCSVSGQAPCKIDEPLPVTPAPTTPTAGATTCADTGIEGFLGENQNGAACCPLGCTKCGGAGCGTIGAVEGLSSRDCCINGVLNNQDYCAVSGEAPCVL